MCLLCYFPLLNWCVCVWDKKSLFYLFISSSAGDAAVNDPCVSVESSQFSSEVLVTQVNMIMFSIIFYTGTLCFIKRNNQFSAWAWANFPLVRTQEMFKPVYLLVQHYLVALYSWRCTVTLRPREGSHHIFQTKLSAAGWQTASLRKKCPPQQLSKLYFIYVRGTAAQEMILVFYLIHLPALSLLSFDCVWLGSSGFTPQSLKRATSENTGYLVLFCCLCVCLYIYNPCTHTL